MNIGNATAGQFVYLAAVALSPGEVAQRPDFGKITGHLHANLVRLSGFKIKQVQRAEFFI